MLWFFFLYNMLILFIILRNYEKILASAILRWLKYSIKLGDIKKGGANEV